MVIGFVAAAGQLCFKSPDVITELHAGREAGFGKLDEIPIDRGTIKAKRMKRLGDVGMRDWTGSFLEMPKHRHTSGRTPKPSLAYTGTDSLIIERF